MPAASAALLVSHSQFDPGNWIRATRGTWGVMGSLSIVRVGLACGAWATETTPSGHRYRRARAPGSVSRERPRWAVPCMGRFIGVPALARRPSIARARVGHRRRQSGRRTQTARSGRRVGSGPIPAVRARRRIASRIWRLGQPIIEPAAGFFKRKIPAAVWRRGEGNRSLRWLRQTRRPGAGAMSVGKSLRASVYARRVPSRW